MELNGVNKFKFTDPYAPVLPAAAMHLTFESAVAGDAPGDIVPSGITVGTYLRGAEGVAAYGSYAADFDGTGYLDTGYALMQGGGSLTVSVWYKGAFDVRPTDNTVMGSSDAFGAGDWLLLEAVSTSTEGKIKFRVYQKSSPSNWNPKTSTTEYSKTDWHHVVFVGEGFGSSGNCEGTVYIDGALSFTHTPGAGACDYESQTLNIRVKTRRSVLRRVASVGVGVDGPACGETVRRLHHTRPSSSGVRRTEPRVAHSGHCRLRRRV
jgi:hypothetical protein